MPRAISQTQISSRGCSSALARALGIALGLLLACRAEAFGAEDAGLRDGIRRANSVERIVRLEYRVVNAGTEALDLTFHLALPLANARQEVLFLAPEPGSANISMDRHGNRIATYVDRGVGPGEVRTHGWIASVRMWAAVHEPWEAAPTLTEEERVLYTRDSPNFQIRSPVVESVRDSLVTGRRSDEAKARAFFEYLIARIAYVRDDRWDPAPEVLERGKGSCSEYTYSLLALLRSSGIPCRYTGGLILTADNVTRYDGRIHEDSVFHRWTEVFLPGYGWFPVDASRGAGAKKRFDNSSNHWGRLPAGSLVLSRGDGGDDSPLGWDYVGNVPVAGKPPLAKAIACIWLEEPEMDLGASLRSVEAMLAAGLRPEELRAAVLDRTKRECLFLLSARVPLDRRLEVAEALLEVRHPEAVYVAVGAELDAGSARRGAPGADTPSEAPRMRAWRSFVNGPLRSGIERSILPPEGNRGNFERFWRKARPRIRYEEKEGLFVLPDESFGLD